MTALTACRQRRRSGERVRVHRARLAQIVPGDVLVATRCALDAQTLCRPGVAVGTATILDPAAPRRRHRVRGARLTQRDPLLRVLRPAAARARLVTHRPVVQRVRADRAVRAHDLRQPRVVGPREARHTAGVFMHEAGVALAVVLGRSPQQRRGVPLTIHARVDRGRVCDC